MTRLAPHVPLNVRAASPTIDVGGDADGRTHGPIVRRRDMLAAASSAAALAIASPAHAQVTVVDPTNLVQNALTAARTLQQINNQIRSLQNEAQHLMQLGQSFAPQLLQRLRAIDTLIEEARGVALRVQETRAALETLFTGDYAGTTVLDRARQAAQRLDASREALKSALLLQAQVSEQMRADQSTLEALTAASGAAPGSLAAQQATNELLAFQAEQSLKLTALLVAQSRAEALERARELEVRAAARAEHDRFFAGATRAHPDARPWR